MCKALSTFRQATADDLDAMGNMASVTTGSTTQSRTHNDANQLTGMGTMTLAYDNSGNVTTDDHGQTLVYDAWNRLVAVKDADGNLIMGFVYDGLGRLVQEVTLSQSGPVDQDLYYSAAWQVTEERTGVTSSSNGSVLTNNVWSPVYADALVLRDRDTDANGSLDERIYVTTDANYNVTGLISASGTVLEHVVYDSFGTFNVTNGSWSSVTENYAWNHFHQDLEYVASIGWYMDRARIYSPTMGRFGQEEPSEGDYIDGLDLYVPYADNPINRVDWSGLASWGPAALTISWIDAFNPGDVAMDSGSLTKYWQNGPGKGSSSIPAVMYNLWSSGYQGLSKSVNSAPPDKFTDKELANFTAGKENRGWLSLKVSCSGDYKLDHGNGYTPITNRDDPSSSKVAKYVAAEGDVAITKKTLSSGAVEVLAKQYSRVDGIGAIIATTTAGIGVPWRWTAIDYVIFPDGHGTVTFSASKFPSTKTYLNGSRALPTYIQQDLPAFIYAGAGKDAPGRILGTKTFQAS